MSNFNIYLERVQESKNYNYIYDESSPQWEKMKREARQIYIGLNMLFAIASLGGIAVTEKMQKDKTISEFQKSAIESVLEYKERRLINSDGTLNQDEISKLSSYSRLNLVDNLSKIMYYTPDETKMNNEEVDDILKKAREEIKKISDENKAKEERKNLGKKNRSFYGSF